MAHNGTHWYLCLAGLPYPGTLHIPHPHHRALGFCHRWSSIILEACKTARLFFILGKGGSATLGRVPSTRGTRLEPERTEPSGSQRLPALWDWRAAFQPASWALSPPFTICRREKPPDGTRAQIPVDSFCLVSASSPLVCLLCVRAGPGVRAGLQAVRLTALAEPTAFQGLSLTAPLLCNPNAVILTQVNSANEGGHVSQSQAAPTAPGQVARGETPTHRAMVSSSPGRE